MLKNKAMPATNVLTSTTISHIILNLFFKQLYIRCLEIGVIGSNAETNSIWQEGNRFKDAEKQDNGIFTV